MEITGNEYVYEYAGSTAMRVVTVETIPESAITESAETDMLARRGTQEQVTEPPPPPPEPMPVPPNYAIWLRMVQCEATGNWHINTGNGFYGGLQFALSSWRTAGGLQYASRPDLATPLQQMWAAERLLSMQGWSAWPACARKLGLR